MRWLSGFIHSPSPERKPAAGGEAAGVAPRPMTRIEFIALAAIMVCGAALRFHGLDWDGGHWLHPDERQIYFVAMNLGWPQSLAEALSPDSPLNPGFFAYGSLPIYLVRIVAELLAPLFPTLRDLDMLHWAGRPLAVLFDLATIALTYRLVVRLWPSGAERDSESGPARISGNGPALLAAALVSLAVLHVQLAHFYTVDPLLTFFVMLVLNLAAGVARSGTWRRQVALGLALGLALATKVSAIPLLLVVLVACTSDRKGSGAEHMALKGRAVAASRCLLVSLAAAGLVFFLVQPYALIDWRTFLDDTIRESQIAWGVIDAPYTRQFAGTLPYLYSVRQTALWGLALPLGLLAWAGLGAALVRWFRRGAWPDTLLLAWAAPYLAIVGVQYTRYLRYMLPLVPVLCIMAVWLLGYVRPRRLRLAASWALGLFSLGYAVAFVTIYYTPHSWVEASAWIYDRLPAGSTLAVEAWDAALPLPLDLRGEPRRIEEYDVLTLALYDEPDGRAKWEALTADLAAADYVIVASRRVYGSVPRLPERYPLANRYYEALFSGGLGFELAGEFTRGPAWLNPRLPPLPDPAPAGLVPDESFVVYDQPRVLIYHNVERLPAGELLLRLAAEG